ncbi:biogenesis of lysosome-related organelles complex 1 subunit 6-like [Hylaeus volcanicus]|uniref:biogenesis of lysosome-related organelles complex 1 subunit 6-like n=1 Tax=Hylaeus volcanicus TaxID=313075 RepID=UPI0023B86262|nr:biogenesis of lysosome-related organelles complex 1 subunit 6-like [Hylaeus volcanicus]XP_053988050.1 biogenesis of lysosome-related organelles complex 1 subunit 6-like [Hylaeus volcanicus]XP_053988052.1 biogenesis of lysosome-related organelles complex 1 subunit 6-like [Hylaeus volcanicus]XP_053988053.1 biogenesis of lysosome-related organelles complex 1 subunit 6-like [Hylaeus volcanicus]
MMTDIEEAEVKKVQSEIDKHESDKVQVDFSDAAKKLAEGLLNIYQLPLEQVQKELNEATSKQEALLAQMQIENKKLQETFENVNLNEMFQTIKVYQGKLTSMKKEMALIHERTFKLKKRALRLQLVKQKEALNREQQREQEIRREQELIGKPIVS